MCCQLIILSHNFLKKFGANIKWRLHWSNIARIFITLKSKKKRDELGCEREKIDSNNLNLISIFLYLINYNYFALQQAFSSFGNMYMLIFSVNYALHLFKRCEIWWSFGSIRNHQAPKFEDSDTNDVMYLNASTFVTDGAPPTCILIYGIVCIIIINIGCYFFR